MDNEYPLASAYVLHLYLLYILEIVLRKVEKFIPSEEVKRYIIVNTRKKC